MAHEFLRVFISGTQDDLQPERHLAAETLRSLGYTPLLAETEGSTNESPEEACVRLAKECDLYIGIFGPRYGSVPRNMTISVTEMEFETARGEDPTKIITYRKAGVPESRQEDFCRRVRDFSEGYLQRPPFDSPSELAQALKDDVPRWVARRLRIHRTPAPTITTRRRRAFVEDDLAPLRSAMDTNDPAQKISVLKDLRSLCDTVQVDRSEEVHSWLWSILGGTVEMRVEALRTVRVFIGVTEAEYRNELEALARKMSRREFDQAKPLPVKQEALNLLGLVVTIDDLDRLMEHILEAPPALYNECRPLYAMSALTEAGHAGTIRQALYAARNDHPYPSIVARIDDILEYIRYRH